MYVKPGHTVESRQDAPAEQGRRLATFPRGANAELRVSLDTHRGYEYISLRVWERDRPGSALYPVKKGCTIRLSEVGGLVEALTGLDAASPGDGEPMTQPERPVETMPGLRGGRKPADAVQASPEDVPRRRDPERYARHKYDVEDLPSPPFTPTRRKGQ